MPTTREERPISCWRLSSEPCLWPACLCTWNDELTYESLLDACRTVARQAGPRVVCSPLAPRFDADGNEVGWLVKTPRGDELHVSPALYGRMTGNARHPS